MERLNALDRRFVRNCGDPALRYDVPPPWWLRHGWLLGVVVGPLGPMVSLAAGPLWAIAVSGLVIGLYAVSAVTWARRHRLPSPP
jgi:hypothetical protein